MGSPEEKHRTTFDPPTIETARLVLSPFGAEDAGLVLEIFVDDPEVHRFVAWRPIVDSPRAEAFAAREDQAWKNEENCRGWIVRRRDDTECIGSVAAATADGRLEFSYVIRREYCNRGYATETAGAILERAASDPAVSEVRAVCDAENLASQRVLEKAGFRQSDRLPAFQKHNITGELRDCVRYTHATD